MDIYLKTQAFYQSVSTEKRVIGKSYFGRELYAVKIGDGKPVGLAQYAIHGREYITAELAFAHYQTGVAQGSLWLLPLSNPDGALLSQIGLDSAPETERKALLTFNGGKEDFSLWKANGRGVDLNVNFPARWGKGERNVKTPAPENYIGEAPLSESESRALQKFTEQIRPDYTVSYHTKGEEIYWYFYQSLRTCPFHKRLALSISLSTGYPLAYAKNSVGGYKDWCIQKWNIPSFTVEVGRDSYAHPLGEEALDDIINKNGRSLYDLSKEYVET